MSYNIVVYGNEILKNIAQEIMNIDEDVINLIDSMFNIMYKSKGIGLAAPQINISKRLIVVDPDDDKNVSLALINPKIKEFSTNQEPYEEGCLSLPGITGNIIRPTEILVSGINSDGKEIEIEASGLLARVLQHEIDHLNGILLIDHLESHMKNELKPELKKIKKLNKKL